MLSTFMAISPSIPTEAGNAGFTVVDAKHSTSE
jgi:hypothetical protein